MYATLYDEDVQLVLVRCVILGIVLRHISSWQPGLSPYNLIDQWNVIQLTGFSLEILYSRTLVLAQNQCLTKTQEAKYTRGI